MHLKLINDNACYIHIIILVYHRLAIRTSYVGVPLLFRKIINIELRFLRRYCVSFYKIDIED